MFEREHENPAPGTQKTYTRLISTTARDIVMIPSLSTTSYYSFLGGTMIALFVVALIIIFVYEYEVLRRSKPTTS